MAGLAALGTLIEQGESPAFYAQKYPESSGVLRLGRGLAEAFFAWNPVDSLWFGMQLIQTELFFFPRLESS